MTQKANHVTICREQKLVAHELERVCLMPICGTHPHRVQQSLWLASRREGSCATCCCPIHFGPDFDCASRGGESAYLTLVSRMNMRLHVAEGVSFWQTQVHPTL